MNHLVRQGQQPAHKLRQDVQPVAADHEACHIASLKVCPTSVVDLQPQLPVGQEDVRRAHAGAGLGVIRGSADSLSTQFVVPGDVLDVAFRLKPAASPRQRAPTVLRIGRMLGAAQFKGTLVLAQLLCFATGAATDQAGS